MKWIEEYYWIHEGDGSLSEDAQKMSYGYYMPVDWINNIDGQPKKHDGFISFKANPQGDPFDITYLNNAQGSKSDLKIGDYDAKLVVDLLYEGAPAQTYTYDYFIYKGDYIFHICFFSAEEVTDFSVYETIVDSIKIL